MNSEGRLKHWARCCVAFFVICLLTGCGSAPQAAPPPPPHIYSINGNWNLIFNSTVTPSLSLGLGGTLTTSGTKVTGTLYVIPTTTPNTILTQCYDVLSAVSVTGTVDSKGLFQIVSGTINNQVLSASGTVGLDNSLLSIGSYSITASDPLQPACAKGDQGSFQAIAMQPLAGTYTGTLTPDHGTPLQATMQLTQSATPDSLGLLHVTGTLHVEGWQCLNNGTIITTGDGTTNPSTFVEGNFALFTFASNDSAATTLGANVQFDYRAKTINFPLYVIYGGACDGASGSAVFTQ